MKKNIYIFFKKKVTIFQRFEGKIWTATRPAIRPPGPGTWVLSACMTKQIQKNRTLNVIKYIIQFLK